MRGGPRGLEVVAAPRDQLPCRIARGARRDAQRVRALQPGAARTGAPCGFQFPQFNELRFRGHGRVGPGLAPALGASERGAGGATGRTAMRRRPRDPGRAAGESRGERRSANLGARTVSARRRSGVAGAWGGGPSLRVPPSLSFSPCILGAPLLLKMMTATTAKGHSETGCF